MEISNYTRELNDDMTLTVLPVIIFIGLLSLLGTFGNLVVMFVYYRKYPKCNFRHFVIVLAGIDFISCVILMPLEIVTLVKWFVFPYSWLCKGKSFLNVFTVTSSAATLLLIAIDRFRKVCYPHSKQIQPTGALKLTILVIFISVIPSTSDAIFWGIHRDVAEFHGRNVLIQMCEKDDKFKDTDWPVIHTLVLYGSTNCIVMIATMILYVLIACKLFCVPSGPENTNSIPLPRISVSSPLSFESDSGVASQRECVFKFPPGDIESGLSESEDMIDSVDLSDLPERASVSVSENGLDDDDKSELNGDYKSDRYNDNPDGDDKNDGANELMIKSDESNGNGVTMRRKNATMEPTSPKKTVRISTEVIRNSYGNELSIPEVEVRRKAPGQRQTKHKANHSPKIPTKLHLRRRRSTIASLPGSAGTRLRRKTLIMFILTAAFVGTTMVYLVLLGILSLSGNFVATLTHAERAAWMFFLRLYFVNSILNPILYGFLDPRFRKALWKMGVHVTWLAGSVKKNIAESIRRSSSSGRSKNVVGDSY